MSRLIFEKERKAKKYHCCSVCGCSICPGDAYVDGAIVEDYGNGIWHWRVCKACKDDKIEDLAAACQYFLDDSDINYFEWAQDVAFSSPEENILFNLECIEAAQRLISRAHARDVAQCEEGS